MFELTNYVLMLSR